MLQPVSRQASCSAGTGAAAAPLLHLKTRPRRAATRIQNSLRELGKLLRAHPAVAVVPALVFSIAVIAGTIGVYFAARAQEDSMHSTATNTAIQAASALQLQLLTMAAPVSAITAFLNSSLALNYTWVHEIYPVVAGNMVSEVSSAAPSSLLTKSMKLQLQQQCTVTDTYPEPNDLSNGYGVDVLALPTFNETVEIMRRRSMVTIMGPLQEYAGDLSFMGAAKPLYLSGVEKDFDFHSPWPVSPFCPPALCWQESTKTKFWGLVSGTWILEDMLRENQGLANLEADGYRWALSQPVADALLSATAGYGAFSMIARSSNGDVQNPIVVPVDLNTPASYQASPWVLSVSPVSGWTLSWEIPMYVAVVVFAFLVSLLLMALMISRVEHQDLLFSLVPKDVVKELKDSGALAARATSAIPAGSTPAEVMLGLLTDCLLGNLPRPAVAVQLRATLLSLQDVYVPAGLSQELREACLDEDVANNLSHLLIHDPMWSGGRDRDRAVTDGGSESTLNADSASVCALYDDLESSLAMLVAGPGIYPEQPVACFRSSLPPSLDLSKGIQYTMSGTLSDVCTDPSAAVTGAHLQLSSPWTKSTRRASQTQSQPSRSSTYQAAMTRGMHDELLSMLGQAFSSWTFDAFALHSASQGHPLSTLGFYLMEKTGLIKHFKLPPAHVARFFQALEAAYIDNPYHSRTHAADVLQTLHIILTQGGFLHSYVDPVRHLACILAAAAHDVEHVGLTNDFLCKAENLLALRYNDRSPSENHHLATLFALLRLPSNDFMKHLSRETRDLVRKVAIEVVMSTDMKQHMTLVAQFKSVHGHGHQARRSTAGVSTDLSFGRASPLGAVGALPVFVDETERLLSLQMAMKVADVGHLAETLQVHKMWVAALEDEFFLQGDKEREAGLPITPLFDRNKPGVTKSQVGFYDFVAMPMFSSFAGVFKDVQPLVDGAAENLRFWKKPSEVKLSLTGSGS